MDLLCCIPLVKEETWKSPNTSFQKVSFFNYLNKIITFAGMDINAKNKSGWTPIMLAGKFCLELNELLSYFMM